MESQRTPKVKVILKRKVVENYTHVDFNTYSEAIVFETVWFGIKTNV